MRPEPESRVKVTRVKAVGTTLNKDDRVVSRGKDQTRFFYLNKDDRLMYEVSYR